ncbi:hypothetical protein [Nocardioides sp. SYSU DS0651]|uniref:hypothetical protein n=1 Tax=Nocardioides sp. SYSU DS0651 TaxID=3415955 RepID=UPI003F4B282C
MPGENTGDQQERAQGLGEAAYGDEGASDRLEDRLDQPQDLEREGQQEKQRQEQEYGDSSAAVSSDTQFADPRKGSDGASFSGDSSQGDIARGESTVFGEPGQGGETSYGADQDAEPARDTYGEPPQTPDEDPDRAETSYGEDQDAAPSRAPYEQG